MASSITTHRWKKLPEAAAYAGLSIPTLRRRIADGSLPARRLGARVIVVDLNDIDALYRPIPTAKVG